jgi:hypothetical protein
MAKPKRSQSEISSDPAPSASASSSKRSKKSRNEVVIIEDGSDDDEVLVVEPTAGSSKAVEEVVPELTAKQLRKEEKRKRKAEEGLVAAAAAEALEASLAGQLALAGPAAEARREARRKEKGKAVEVEVEPVPIPSPKKALKAAEALKAKATMEASVGGPSLMSRRLGLTNRAQTLHLHQQTHLLASLLSAVSCMVCLETLNKPYSLECGHVLYV